jgi:hypothetical protein
MLTRLELIDVDGSVAMDALQQLLVRPPPLRVLHLGLQYWFNVERPPSLDISCSKQLHEFTCDALLGVAVLPVQLRRLDVGDSCVCQHLDLIMQLQQLTALCGAVYSDKQELLLRLTQLPALQELHLHYFT